MHSYGVRDVEKLLRLSRSTIRSLIAAGFVTPARGPRGAWLFSFQDLIVLRTAQALVDADVPPRRIMRSMRELRRHLPDTMPLSGLNIGAVADRVVVREGGSRWHAESGQYLLSFDGDPADGSLSVIERGDADDESRGAEAWFDQAVMLEREDVDAALAAYEHAIVADRTLPRRLYQPGPPAARDQASGRRPRAFTARRSKPAATIPSCSSISVCCSMT